MKSEKTCIICNKVFYRQKGVSNKVWERRKCCCRNCSNYSRRKDVTNLKWPARALLRRIDTEKGITTTYA